MHLTPQPLTQLMQPFNHQDTQGLSQSLSSVPCLVRSCTTTVDRKVRVSFSRICLQIKYCCLQAAVNMYCLLGGGNQCLSNKYVYSANEIDGVYYCPPFAFLKVSFPQMFNNLNMRLTEIPPNMC